MKVLILFIENCHNIPKCNKKNREDKTYVSDGGINWNLFIFRKINRRLIINIQKIATP